MFERLMRGEASVVHAFDSTFAFGRGGGTRTQARGLLEGGLVF